MKDPFILLSYVNTLLRDEYPSLRELCKAKDLSAEETVKTLRSIGFEYDEKENRFR